jgi:hypothetical protein
MADLLHIPGAVAIGELIAEYEKDPAMKKLLDDARTRLLALEIDDEEIAQMCSFLRSFNGAHDRWADRVQRLALEANLWKAQAVDARLRLAEMRAQIGEIIGPRISPRPGETSSAPTND